MTKTIRWISEDGGEWKILFKEEKEYPLGIPQMLPDGESVLFTTGSALPHKIMVHSLKSGESKELFPGGFASYIKSGHIVYGVGSNLYARPFDAGTIEVTGEQVLLVEGVLSGSWVWHYAVSDSGTLVYVPGKTTTVEDMKTLVWVIRGGKEEAIAAPPDDYRDLKISLMERR